MSMDNFKEQSSSRELAPCGSDAGVHRKAAQLAAAGDHGTALQLLSALGERQRGDLGPSHPALGRTLGELALIAFVQGNSREAQPLAESALDILRQTLGPLNPTLVHRMREFAEAAEKAGDAAFAETLRQRVAQIGTLPVANAISPLNADTLHGFAKGLAARGEFEAAERQLREAIRIRRTAAASRWDLAEALSDLGEVLRRTGRFNDAELVEAEAYAIIEEENAPGPTRAMILSNYGLLKTKTGNFTRSRELYQQAIDLYRADNPCSHNLGIAVFNMAALYEAMADVTTAERFYVEAADILKRSVGVDHLSFSLVANNLGNLYRLTRRPAAAENLLRRAVDVRRHHLGDQHPWLAASLINLGLAHCYVGRLTDAADAMNEAIGILEGQKLPGIDLSHAYQALSVVHSMGRDWASADTLLEKAIRLQEAALGPNSPVLAHMLSNLAYTRAACDRPDEALSLMERVASIENVMLESVSSVLSDEQRLGFLAQLSSHLTQVLAIVWRNFATSPEGVRTAFRHVLTRKAISAEVMAAQRDAIFAGSDPQTRAQVQRLSEISGEIGRLATEGPGSGSRNAHIRMLADLQSKREAVEARLASKIPEIALRRRLMSVDVNKLAAALPQNSVLIAFILSAGEPNSLRFVEIGAASRVDDLIGQVRDRIVRSGRSLFARLRRPTFQEDGRELSQIIIGPLRPFLDEGRRIFVSPDGMLNMLPFEVLAFDANRLVLDCFEVSYVASGRDLLRFGRQGSSSAPAIVVADPNFDLAQAGSEGEADPRAPHFNRLPGTREEGMRVAALLGVKPWLGNDALESRLKKVSSPQILHIATHGYFHSGGALEAVVSNAEAGLKGLAEHLTASTISANPLLRSGLALAAANWRFLGSTPPEEAEDGLLAAFDVTGLNLTGTQLAVLSACVTGLGEIHPSEGTMGLRRSFTIAGAAALLVSLWNVPDRATKTLMLKLYRSLGRGMAPGAALRRAQADMRRWNRNPYFWGAFVCHGDGSRPLAQGQPRSNEPPSGQSANCSS